MQGPGLDQSLVARALAGDRDALRRFVDLTSPIVQARVARALVRSRAGRSQGRDLRQEIEDMTQEVFAALFADDARALRAFDPQRGLSLANFVGLVAQHQVASILRRGRRNPWTEEPMVDDELDRAIGALPSTAARIESRELFARLLERLRAELTPRGLELFELLVVREQSAEEVTAQTGMSADAVYAWRSRLGKLVKKLVVDIESPQRASETTAPRRIAE